MKTRFLIRYKDLVPCLSGSASCCIHSLNYTPLIFVYVTLT